MQTISEMFCDMVGFTELAARVDPEVLRRVIRLYEDACTGCITRYEGYVYQRLGGWHRGLFWVSVGP